MHILSRFTYLAKLFFQTHPWIKKISESSDIFVFFAQMFMATILMLIALTSTEEVFVVINVVGATSLSVLSYGYYSQRITRLNLFARSIIIFSGTFLFKGILISQFSTYLEMVDQVSAAPGKIIVSVLLGWVLWSLLKYTHPSQLQHCFAHDYRPSYVRMEPFEKLGPWSKTCRWDAELIAAHEAGHAVALGLFPYFTDKIEVTLQMGVDSDQVVRKGGYCRGNDSQIKAESMSYHDIRMITILAGAEAEKVCFGERTTGSTSDYEKFIEYAKRRLQMDDESIYYSYPQNDFEAKHNTDSIMALKTKYQKITQDLLNENREILDLIRTMLVDKGIIKGKELADILMRVKPVPGCPTISASLDAALKADVEAVKAEESKA